jgi:hypothetical protein
LGAPADVRFTPESDLQVMFEWQRDWARAETYDGCMAIFEEHSLRGAGAQSRR